MPPSSLFGSKSVFGGLTEEERKFLTKQTKKGGRNKKRNKKRKTRKKCRSSFFLRSLRKKTRQRGGREGECDREGWNECNKKAEAILTECNEKETSGSPCYSEYAENLANCDNIYFCS